MRAEITWTGEGYQFEGSDANGNAICIDGEGEAGVSPMDSVLMAVGSCGAVDILYLMRKMKQEVSSLVVEVDGERQEKESAKPWKSIRVIFHVKGSVEEKQLSRAVQLSFEKYCSVALSLRPQMDIEFTYTLNKV